MANPSPINDNSTGVRRLVELADPLIVLEVLVHALRYRFSGEYQGDPDVTTNWQWLDDVKNTKILIESGFNENAEERNGRPGIWVDRLQMTSSMAGIGYQDQIPEVLSTGVRRFYATGEMDIGVDCTAEKRGESMVIGSIVHMFLLTAREPLMAYYGIRDMSPFLVKQTVPYERDKELMNTPIQFRVFFETRWKITPAEPIIRKATLTVSEEDAPTNERHIRLPEET